MATIRKCQIEWMGLTWGVEDWREITTIPSPFFILKSRMYKEIIGPNDSDLAEITLLVDEALEERP